MPVANNTGIAVGSFIGGLVVKSSGLVALPWLALAFTVVAFVITALSYQLDRKHKVEVQDELAPIHS